MARAPSHEELESALKGAGMGVRYIRDHSPMVGPGELTVIAIAHEPRRSRWQALRAHFRRRPMSYHPSATEWAWESVANIMFFVGMLMGLAAGIALQGLL